MSVYRAPSPPEPEPEDAGVLAFAARMQHQRVALRKTALGLAVAVAFAGLVLAVPNVVRRRELAASWSRAAACLDPDLDGRRDATRRRASARQLAASDDDAFSRWPISCVEGLVQLRSAARDAGEPAIAHAADVLADHLRIDGRTDSFGEDLFTLDETLRAAGVTRTPSTEGPRAPALAPQVLHDLTSSRIQVPASRQLFVEPVGSELAIWTDTEYSYGSAQGCIVRDGGARLVCGRVAEETADLWRVSWVTTPGVGEVLAASPCTPGRGVVRLESKANGSGVRFLSELARTVDENERTGQLVPLDAAPSPPRRGRLTCASDGAAWFVEERTRATWRCTRERCVVQPARPQPGNRHEFEVLAVVDGRNVVVRGDPEGGLWASVDATPTRLFADVRSASAENALASRVKTVDVLPAGRGSAILALRSESHTAFVHLDLDTAEVSPVRVEQD